MAKAVLPEFDESLIRNLANEPSLARGKSYYHDGAILEPICQGMELRAYCQGSRYEPYQVSVTLARDSVASTACTCPYDGFGICKHIVALLLTYVHTPQAFRVIPPLDAMLAQRSKTDLIALIDVLVKRNPGLMPVVERSAGTQQARPMDVEASRRHVRHALRYASLSSVKRELQALWDTAGCLERAGDRLGAGAIYHLLLAETVRHYSNGLQVLDENGDLARLVGEFAEGLGRCLKEGQPDRRTRHAWLEALLAAELTDIELGGIDLAPRARNALLEHATDADWAWIEKRARAQIYKSRDWARETLVHFLSEHKEHEGQAQEAAALIHELGTPEQRVFLLVDEGKIDEAVPLMQHILTGKPGLVEQFADILLEAGAAEVAVTLVREHAQGGAASVWHADWLARYYHEHGRPQDAVEWLRKVFLEGPSIETFKLLRRMSRKMGTWDRVRGEMLKALERKKQIGALIELALHERDAQWALELLPRLSQWESRRYRREIARAAEKSHPREALALYRGLAERAIGGRQRRTYHQAIHYLKRMRALYRSLRAQSDWDAYLQSLRAQYAHLPALQDELRMARL